MFLDISVKDMIDVKNQRVSYNEVILTRRDVVDIQKLMQYFYAHHIHFEESLRLDSLLIQEQNEIGVIFFEYYGFTIEVEGRLYLKKSKFIKIFHDSEIMMSYITRSEKLAPTTVEDALVLEILSTEQLNDIILNWFSTKYRNFRSIKKHVPESTNLFDINLNKGYFSKVTNRSEFLADMFDRFVRTSRGGIPFSNDFGSSIKESLQTKATFFSKKIILEELTDFVTTLSNIYSDDFNLVNIDYKEEVGISVKIIIKVTLQANKEDPIVFVLK